MVVNFHLKAQKYDYTLLNGLKTHLEQGCEKHNAINGHLEKCLRLKGQGCLLSLWGKTVKDLLHIYIFFRIVLLQRHLEVFVTLWRPALYSFPVFECMIDGRYRLLNYIGSDKPLNTE